MDYTSVQIDPTDTVNPPPNQFKRFTNIYCGTGSADISGIQNADIPSKCGNFSLPATLGWVSDTRDSAINPTRGGLQRANTEVAIPGGDLKYYKLTYQLQRFFPVTRSVVLMLNGELGYGKGLGGQALPFYRNFYAGGVGSVRGYDTPSLGPYEMSSTGTPLRLGGTKRVVFNAELTMPLQGLGTDNSVRLGPFFDAGQVYGDGALPPGVFAEGPIRMSTGMAATWVSPFGPLKFSVGQPINKQTNDKIQRFQFQMGTAF